MIGCHVTWKRLHSFMLPHWKIFPPIFFFAGNDGIHAEHSSVRYGTIQNAITLVKAVGQNCFLAKNGIKNAFRIIPVHPTDYPLLGICWNGQFF